MSNVPSAPLTAAELRSLRDRTELLPAGPWEAVELSHLELHGPSLFDPDVDFEERSWRANEQRRGATAAWRGIRAADGTRIVGEPLGGGRPVAVHSAELVWLAGMRVTVPRMLATLRELWPRPGQPTAAPPVPGPSPETLEAAARAAYEQVPALERWDQIPAAERRVWITRVEAALAALAGA